MKSDLVILDVIHGGELMRILKMCVNGRWIDSERTVDGQLVSFGFTNRAATCSAKSLCLLNFNMN